MNQGKRDSDILDTIVYLRNSSLLHLTDRGPAVSLAGGFTMRHNPLRRREISTKVRAAKSPTSFLYEYANYKWINRV